ncbi:class I lanthipeptide [Taibaiella koreensis]|uniref:class I lanthipeptide n=1 Tax=Taibaiella koreensis TaxID=1268548 RepID=UPI0013C31199|nr:class I lanthipeptide [Taibaiella koreensis]
MKKKNLKLQKLALGKDFVSKLGEAHYAAVVGGGLTDTCPAHGACQLPTIFLTCANGCPTRETICPNHETTC